ncbi:MAG: 6-carboxytetrahydropterin synthase [Acidobacteria bacterium]|nr:6-carboxytetrahydropterin synthase [Acidobacteriota bacterium]
MTRLTRRYRFSASHRLHSPALSDDANRALYGKCNHPHGHGHNYILEVSLTGPLDEHGRVADRAALDGLVETAVLGEFRYRNLNLDVPEFAHLVPTSENVARVIERRLELGWRNAFPGPAPRLEKIRLFETERNIVEK